MRRLEHDDPDWLLNTEKGFVAFFRPRCGSTTLTRWFFENLGYEFGGFSIAEFRNDWFRERADELQAALDERYPDLHRFVVVREPLDRAVSSYLHVVNNPQDYQWDVVRPHIDPAIGKHDLTFRQFVEFLTRDDLDTAALIWRRQSSLTCWERGGVNDIVQLGALNEYLEGLNARYGFSRRPGFNSVTVPAGERVVPDRDGETFFGDAPFHELLRFKGTAGFEQFPDYPLFYDDELTATIQELYKDDIRIWQQANVTVAEESDLEGTTTPITAEPVFEGKNFRIAISAGRPVFQSASGELLVSECTPVFATCRTYDLDGPVADMGRVLPLRSVDGLAAGDWVEVRKDIYGGAARPSRAYGAQIASIDEEKRTVELATAIPARNFSPELALYVLKVTEERDDPADRGSDTADEDGTFVLRTTSRFPSCDVDVVYRCGSDSPHVVVECTVRYTEDAQVYSQGITLVSAVPVEEIYKKNRQLERVSGQGPSDYWLWKEGARFRGRSASWSVPRVPAAAMVELRGARGHYRRSTVDVRIEDASDFPAEGDHALDAALKDGGSYASSVARKGGVSPSDPVGFSLGFPHEITLGGLEIQWYDAATFASSFEVWGRVGGSWERLLDVADHAPDDQRSTLYLPRPTPVDAIRFVARATERVARLAIRRLWCLETDPGGPELGIAFEHHAARNHRRFLGTGPGEFHRFEERSSARYSAGDEVRYRFDLFISDRLPPTPRLKLSPAGFKATHVWTEHADNTHIRTHRAAYFGSDEVEHANDAIGGFVRHGHRVTKSVFFDNPTGMPNNSKDGSPGEFGEMASLVRDPAFASFVDELHGLGHEICLHTTAPVGVARDEEAGAIGEVSARFGSHTWIEHDMQQIRSNFSCDGPEPGTPWYRADLWEDNGVRYFWQWASEDFMLQDGSNLDLLHEAEGPATVTPLYWPTGRFVTWGATEGSLAALGRRSIDNLVDAWGVSVDHQYYAYLRKPTWDPGYLVFEDGRFRIAPEFDEALAYMSELRDHGDLNIATIGEVLEYWLAVDQVTLTLDGPNTFAFSNSGTESISAFAFVVAAGQIASDDVDFAVRDIAPNERFVWFDFEPAATVRFYVGD